MLKKKKKQPKKTMVDYDLMEELDYYQKPKPKKAIDQKLVIAAVLLVIFAAVLLFSPIFAVKEIRAEGASRFTTSALCEMIGLSTGDNILTFSKSKAEAALEKDPYIADAKLSIDLPDTMIITLKERKVRGYVPYMGSYLYIDEEGRVLDVQDAYFEALPLVKGLSFESFVNGEIIPVKNPEALDVVLEVSQMMEKYELLDLVVEIDVSDPEDVYAYVNQVQIHLGDMENGDTKIRYMAEIMKTIPAEDRGILDLSELDNPKKSVVFQYLT